LRKYFFKKETSQNRERKMRSAQRYTARGKRNTQKLEKQSELCAIETRDGG